MISFKIGQFFDHKEGRSKYGPWTIDKVVVTIGLQSFVANVWDAQVIAENSQWQADDLMSAFTFTARKYAGKQYTQIEANLAGWKPVGGAAPAVEVDDTSKSPFDNANDDDDISSSNPNIIIE